MRELFLLASIFFSGIILIAQVPTVDWAYSFGGNSYESIWSSAMDDQQNIYTVGFFQDTVDFDQGPGSAIRFTSAPGSFGMFLQKLDANGNLLWVKTWTVDGDIGSIDTEIRVSLDGGLYLSGIFSSDSTDFDPDSITTHYLKGSNNGSPFILKLDSNGDFKWAVAQNGDFTRSAMAIDASGNLYTTGHFKGTIDSDPDPTQTNSVSSTPLSKYDGFVEKLDSSGNQLWFKTITGQENIRAWDIAINNLNEPVAVGNFVGTVDFDPGAGTSQVNGGTHLEGFILKLDSLGNFKKVLSTSGSGHSKFTEIEIGKDGSTYLAGSFKPNADLDPNPGTYTSTASQKGWFIEKLFPNDNLAWVHPYSNSLSSEQSHPLSLSVDQNKNVLVGGYFQGDSLDLQPSKSGGIAFSNPNQNAREAFLAKHDSLGHVVWGHSFGTYFNDRVLSIQGNNMGEFIVSGYYSGPLNYDPYDPSMTFTHRGVYDAYIFKFNACPPTMDSTISISACKYYELAPGQRFYSDTLLIDTIAGRMGCDSLLLKQDVDIYQLPATINANNATLTWDSLGLSGYTFSWLNCDSNTVVPNQSGPSFSPTQSGNYALILSDGNCTDTSACLSVNDVSLNEIQALGQISVYPNPVQGELSASGEDGELYDLKIIDFSGRVLKTKENTSSISFSDLNSGMYLLSIANGSESVLKIVVRQ